MQRSASVSNYVLQQDRWNIGPCKKLQPTPTTDKAAIEFFSRPKHSAALKGEIGVRYHHQLENTPIQRTLNPRGPHSWWQFHLNCYMVVHESWQSNQCTLTRWNVPQFTRFPVSISRPPCKCCDWLSIIQGQGRSFDLFSLPYLFK